MEGPCTDKFQFVVHVPGRVWGGTAFAKRSEAMKATVGLLNGSAVCDSRWRGVAPTSTPNKSTSETRRSLRSEVPDGPSSTRGKEPSASVGGSFCFAGALRDGVVYSAWFNNSEFIKENIDETIFMLALFKCMKSDKGRNWK